MMILRIGKELAPELMSQPVQFDLMASQPQTALRARPVCVRATVHARRQSTARFACNLVSDHPTAATPSRNKMPAPSIGFNCAVGNVGGQIARTWRLKMETGSIRIAPDRSQTVSSVCFPTQIPTLDRSSILSLPSPHPSGEAVRITPVFHRSLGDGLCTCDSLPPWPCASQPSRRYKRLRALTHSTRFV